MMTATDRDEPLQVKYAVCLRQLQCLSDSNLIFSRSLLDAQQLFRAEPEKSSVPEDPELRTLPDRFRARLRSAQLQYSLDQAKYAVQRRSCFYRTRSHHFAMLDKRCL